MIHQPERKNKPLEPPRESFGRLLLAELFAPPGRNRFLASEVVSEFRQWWMNDKCWFRCGRAAGVKVQAALNSNLGGQVAGLLQSIAFRVWGCFHAPRVQV